DTAFPRMRRPLAYKSTPRALRMRESHRLNGTLTRLNSERTAQKIFLMRWDKSGVVGLVSRLMLADFRFFIRAKRVYFNSFLANVRNILPQVIAEGNTN
ncbi:MAG: hypothetical protein SPF41_02115, partial [Candidatus Merdousia sp.]|nr:hypothetical protein [Candidatus Merdousia sp.]